MKKSRFWFLSLVVWFMIGNAFEWSTLVKYIVILNSVFVIYLSISGLIKGEAE